MQQIKSRAALEAGLAALAGDDRRLAALWRRAGTPTLRRRPADIRGLFRVVVGQQLSVDAAAAIWRRLEALLAPMTPAKVLAARPDELRAAGLSRQKIAFGRALAQAVEDGTLGLRTIARAGDEEAIAALTEVKGIGRWTAECFLLFAQGRPDMWPADDLALAVATQRLLSLESRPPPRELRAHAAAWAPYRSVAARLLWHGYGRAVL